MLYKFHRCQKMYLGRSFLISLMAFFLNFSGAKALTDAKLNAFDWLYIQKLATDFVRKESPSSVWFFQRPDGLELGLSSRKVFAHYFPSFPLSLDNHAPSEDYYALGFLIRSGENNKYSKVGGYFRQRPLPMSPLPDRSWQEIGLAIEILRADLIGLDGFGIDLLTFEGPLWARTQLLYDVAAAIAPDFHIVAEPDMASLKDYSAHQLAVALTPLLTREAAYRLPDGRHLVMPFLAENKPPDFWQQLSDELAAQGVRIALMLDFLNPSGEGAYATKAYGFSYWGLRDPVASAANPSGQIFVQSSMQKTTEFMAPVAPQDERPKDAIFWEAHNTSLFQTLWMQAIAGPARYVHLITWNDYSEASEISPSTGTQFVFYDLCAYYLQWFKLGYAPVIEHDAIFYTQRRQIMRPEQRYLPDDTVFKLQGSTKLSNEIEMLAFLQAPATLEIELGGRKFEKPGQVGLNFFRVPTKNELPVFRIKKGSQIVVEKIGDWIASDNLGRQDPLYVGGSSTRPFISDVQP